MAIFHQVLGCPLFSHWNSLRWFYFLIRLLVGGPGNYLLLFLLSNYKTCLGLSALSVPSHLSQGMGNAVLLLAGYKALGRSMGLSQVLLALTHLQAFYTLCPFCTGCGQILQHWCSGTGSLYAGRPQPTWRFYHFPNCTLRFGLEQDTHHQNCSGSSSLPRGSLLPLEWENSVWHEHTFFWMYW